MPSRPAARRNPLDALRPESLRGAPGFFRVGQDVGGRWWLIRPDGALDFGCGVDSGQTIPGRDEGSVVAQLQDWGANALGPTSAPALFAAGLPFIESLDLSRAGDFRFRLGGARLPDVFDPRWLAAAEERVAAVVNHPDRIGWVADTDLAWASGPAAGVAAGRPSLLQVCLSLDPRFSAYHAAWEFALAPYGGEFAALARDWRVQGPNKEALRQWTIEDRVIDTPAYREAQNRFAAEFAQRYFRLSGELVRRYAPGVLLFAPVLPSDLAPVAEAWVDVRFVDELPAAAGPVWRQGFSWVPAPSVRVARGRLSALERMHRDGRAALEAAIRHPGMIGVSWAHHVGGDRAEEAPFGRGLLADDGLPAPEHVQPLAAIYRAARALHTRG